MNIPLWLYFAAECTKPIGTKSINSLCKRNVTGAELIDSNVLGPKGPEADRFQLRHKDVYTHS